MGLHVFLGRDTRALKFVAHVRRARYLTVVGEPFVIPPSWPKKKVRFTRASWQCRVAGRSSSSKASTCYFLVGLVSDVMGGSDVVRGTWQGEEGRECRFVFIGKEMKQNAENLKRDFLLCAAEENLRFEVGDQVQAQVGGWKNATVITTWDDVNCYRLRLARQDANQCVGSHRFAKLCQRGVERLFAVEEKSCFQRRKCPTEADGFFICDKLMCCACIK